MGEGDPELCCLDGLEAHTVVLATRGFGGVAAFVLEWLPSGSVPDFQDKQLRGLHAAAVIVESQLDPAELFGSAEIDLEPVGGVFGFVACPAVVGLRAEDDNAVVGAFDLVEG